LCHFRRGRGVRRVIEIQKQNAHGKIVQGKTKRPKRWYTRIALLEPKSGQVLWSSKHKTEGGKIKGGHLPDALREAFRDYEKGKR
jgi:hypothetical protein